MRSVTDVADITETTHKVLDGSSVFLSYVERPNVDDVSTDATSIAAYRVGPFVFEFTAGPLALGRGAVAETLQLSNLEEVYSVQGGELHTGEKRFFDANANGEAVARAGAWEGERGSIFTILYGHSTTNTILSLFNSFRISEMPDGITMLPVADEISIDDGPVLARYVPGIGLLEVRALTDRAVAGIPRWKGTDIKGGELFTDVVGPSADPYFVLVNATTSTVIMPDPDGDLDMALDHLESLNVEWVQQVTEG